MQHKIKQTLLSNASIENAIKWEQRANSAYAKGDSTYGDYCLSLALIFVGHIPESHYAIYQKRLNSSAQSV